MSQMVTRKGSTEKRPDSPAKDMKRKLVVNLEREKAPTPEKTAEKLADKGKPADKKTDKAAEKATEKKGEKSTEVPQKNGNVTEKEKKDSKDSKQEKKNAAGEKSGVSEKKDDKVEKNGKPEKEKPKERTIANANSSLNANGNAKQQNGSKQNGCNGSPGSVSGDSSSDDVALVVDEHEDEFPELTYEESDEFEPPTPESGRSFTRRSQVKPTRTPETPRPPSEKLEKQPATDEVKPTCTPETPRPPTDKQEKQPATEETKDSKVLKLKEDANSDRKLRSSDAPKEDPKKAGEKKEDGGKKENGENGDKLEVEVMVEIETEEGGEERQRRKEDTNYSKSRVKVSPYRRSMRLDQTISSVQANYTGNNTTMEMDITESSFAEEPSIDDLSSSYLSAVRSMRGRRSYKQLKELNITRIPRAVRTPVVPAAALDSSRPTGTVVGRKRKPDADDAVEIATEAGEVSGKRIRLLDRLARPFRRVPIVETPLHSEIVGIYTDLPLTTPIVSSETNPETLKASSVTVAPAIADMSERDGKRCVVM